jgi:tRNA threonylcarbamoyladenosine biosynthesis protein TsaB
MGKTSKGKGKSQGKDGLVGLSITLACGPSWRETLLVLALDTTTRAGSVAVLRDGSIAAAIIGDPSVTHGERLPRELARALEEAGAPLESIDLLAVAAGPGSFTGLRVGIASIQGLAFARGLRVVPVPTLDALAQASAGELAGETRIAAWLDAQRGEVFAALYAADARTLVAAPTCLTPVDTLQTWRAVLGTDAVVFTGDGALRYGAVIIHALGRQARILDGVAALAPAIARIAAETPDRAVLPHAVVPIYIRRPDAELARDRRAGTG